MCDKTDPGCWQAKANQCFDKWYKDIFLQNKSNGEVGCQKEYEIYMKCYSKELRKDKQLVEGIRSVMHPEVQKRWDAQEQKFEK